MGPCVVTSADGACTANPSARPRFGNVIRVPFSPPQEVPLMSAVPDSDELLAAADRLLGEA